MIRTASKFLKSAILSRSTHSKAECQNESSSASKTVGAQVCEESPECCCSASRHLVGVNIERLCVSKDAIDVILDERANVENIPRALFSGALTDAQFVRASEKIPDEQPKEQLTNEATTLGRSDCDERSTICTDCQALSALALSPGRESLQFTTPPSRKRLQTCQQCQSRIAFTYHDNSGDRNNRLEMDLVDVGVLNLDSRLRPHTTHRSNTFSPPINERFLASMNV